MMGRLVPVFSEYQYSPKINKDIEEVLLDYKCKKLSNPFVLLSGTYYIGDQVIRFNKKDGNYYISVNLLYYRQFGLHMTFYQVVLDNNGERIDSHAVFAFDENQTMMEDIETVVDVLSNIIVIEIDQIFRNNSLNKLLVGKNTYPPQPPSTKEK